MGGTHWDVLTTRISGGELPSEVLERLHSFSALF